MTTDENATDRRARMAEAIAAHRKAGSQSPIVFATDTDDPLIVEYKDREITIEVTDRQRERLDELLADFPVFKIAQPETRKAPAGEIHVSALSDPKHAADFLYRVFLDVFDCEADFDLIVK